MGTQVKHLIKQHITIYGIAIAATLMASFLAVISPYIIGTTIDTILGELPYSSDLSRSFFDYLGGRDFLRNHLPILGGTILLLNALSGICGFVKGKYGARASEGIAQSLRERLYSHLLYVPYQYHVRCDKGDILQRCTSDIHTIQSFFAREILNIASSVFLFLLALTLMLSMSGLLTLFALVTVVPFAVLSHVFSQKISKIYEKVASGEGRLTHIAQENFNGIRVVRAFGKQEKEMKKFVEQNLIYADCECQAAKTVAFFRTITESLSFFQMMLLMIAGVFLVVGNHVTIGTLISFYVYQRMILHPAQDLIRILGAYAQTRVSIRRLDEVLLEASESIHKNLKLPSLSGDIEFRDVSFAYNDKPVLKNISLTIRAGSIVAIFGPSGAGKSTLALLLQRLLDYESGSITISGVELKEIDKEYLRRNVGFVLQETFLFSDTIRSNIVVTDPNAAWQQIEEAAEAAGIREDIERFGDKYDTLVGEKGLTLSGGQKQRVSIARTLLKKKPILILDDAFSAVDSYTEKLIWENIRLKGRNTTVILISHRMKCVKDADEIIVLEHGVVTQRGKHTEIIKQEGMYKRIWDMRLQLEDEIEAEGKEEEHIA